MFRSVKDYVGLIFQDLALCSNTDVAKSKPASISYARSSPNLDISCLNPASTEVIELIDDLRHHSEDMQSTSLGHPPRDPVLVLRSLGETGSTHGLDASNFSVIV